MNKRFFALTGLFAATAVVLAACGSAGASNTPADATTATSDEPTTIVVDPVTPTVAPETPATDPVTPAPVDEPVEEPAPLETPRVLWMRSSHAGPGVVTIRFETNVPTTATVKVMTNQVGPAAFFTEDLETLATNHTVSVPANAFGRYQARVEDDFGNVAWAEMRYLKDLQGVDWATGANAPALVAPTAKKLDIAYVFPAGHSTKLGFDGLIHVFSTAATCTTADSCVGDLVGQPIEVPATGNAQLESHKASAGIAGSAFNYQVVIGQPLNPKSSTMVFMQLEIRGDQLPKVNFQGPGNIKP